MPDAVVHGTLPTGAAQEIGATEDGRLEVDADFSNSSVDAFGRLRVSSPFTLFDSSHRYADNGLWETNTASGGAANFSANAGLVELSVNTASGSTVKRETKRVFAYQPGKSLFSMNSFVMAPAQSNLVQRVGYFGESNGIYLEQNGSEISFVQRSLITGSVVSTSVSRSNWNVDKLDGSGPSGYTLDLSKSQILWLDLEWLGVGNPGIGFVIDREFICCHTFKNANVIASTYMTTACLPLRYEIFSTAALSTSATMKQICSTVMSEGGYELRGLQQAIGTPVTAHRSTLASGAYLPIASIRLKTSPNRLDAIAILSAINALGDGSGNVYAWQVLAGATTSGGSWVSAGTNSSVEYNITGTSIADGRVLASGYFASSNQSSNTLNITGANLFKYQLERNSFTSTPYELTFAIAGASSGQAVWGSMDWEEVSR